MGIFSKPLTLVLMLSLLEDENHPSPGDSAAARNKLAVKIMGPVIKKHYLEALKPPVKWNYYFAFVSAPGNAFKTEYAHLDFRDAVTNEISRQKQFFDFCDEMKIHWLEGLAQDNPKYDRKKLLAAAANPEYDWFPEYGLAVISALLPGYVKKGAERFKGSV